MNSSIILREFDDAVGGWCREKEIVYTRYCGDMTFSGAFHASEVKAFVSARLRGLGFFLNEKKTKLVRVGKRQTVTSIVAHKKPGVPAEYRRKLRQELYFCKKFGVVGHLSG